MYTNSTHVQAVMYAHMHEAIYKHTVMHTPQMEPHVLFPSHSR